MHKCVFHCIEPCQLIDLVLHKLQYSKQAMKLKVLQFAGIHVCGIIGGLNPINTVSISVRKLEVCFPGHEPQHQELRLECIIWKTTNTCIRVKF